MSSPETGVNLDIRHRITGCPFNHAQLIEHNRMGQEKCCLNQRLLNLMIKCIQKIVHADVSEIYSFSAAGCNKGDIGDT